jgi:hypothetical protein
MTKLFILFITNHTNITIIHTTMTEKLQKSTKFCIKEKLNLLPKKESLLYGRTLYKKLGISRSTWSNYLNAKPEDEYDLPLTNAIKLAKFFNCPVEELINISISGITIADLKELDEK